MTEDRPRRLTILAGSTVVNHSRIHRIASSFVARGVEVTVIGRWKAGLPLDERHPGGYRIRRVIVAPKHGLPRPLATVGGWILRRLDRAPKASIPGSPAPAPAAAAETAPGSTVSPAAAASPTPGPTSARADDPEAELGGAPARGSLPRRVASAAIGALRAPLVLRGLTAAIAELEPQADLVHAQSHLMLPAGLALGRRLGVPVVYDAGDVYAHTTLRRTRPWHERWYLLRVERRSARRAAAVVTTNDGYADLIASLLGVPRPVSILNCAPVAETSGPSPAGRPDRIRDALGLPTDRRIVLYHGGLTPERGIEQGVAAIADVPDAAFVLLGYGSMEGDLRRRAASGPDAGRVFLLPAVPPDALLEWVASADVALMAIQGTTENHRLTTPNKLFEAMAAGTPVVASDLPGMAPIVRATGCGLVCDPADPSAIAAAIRAILGDPVTHAAMAEAGRRAARERYNWEAQALVLAGVYEGVTGRSW